jgi:hypothetical protein
MKHAGNGAAVMTYRMTAGGHSDVCDDCNAQSEDPGKVNREIEQPVSSKNRAVAFRRS